MRTYLIVGEIEGKLDVLCVECTKCARKGRYHVLRYTAATAICRWLSDLKGDCPKRDAHSLHKRCDLQCPDLPKVL
jgi:hypothetical protein